MNLGGALADYFHAVIPYWWVLLTGAIMPFVDALKWHGRPFEVPKRVRIILTIGIFFVAQFLAYRDAIRNTHQAEQEKAEAIGDRDRLRVNKASLESANNVLQQQLAAKNSPIILQVPQKLGDRMAIVGWMDPQPVTNKPPAIPVGFEIKDIQPGTDLLFNLGYRNSGPFEARNFKMFLKVSTSNVNVAETQDYQFPAHAKFLSEAKAALAKAPGASLAPGREHWTTEGILKLDKIGIASLIEGHYIFEIRGYAMWVDTSGSHSVNDCVQLAPPLAQAKIWELTWHICQ